MIIDQSLQKFIDDILIADNAERDAKHEPSGLLSASMLYQPTRFQVMKNIGVPRKQMEPYVLGKFNRGNDCEDWLVDKMQKAGVLLETQKPVKYRNVVGFIDMLIDTNKMYFKQGSMPHEVKSVTNMKLKRIASQGVDYHYQLQGCLYGLAEGSDYYAIDILSGEDLRLYTYIFETKDMKADVDMIIDKYDQAMKDWNEKHVLPALEVNPKVAWAVVPDYAPFSKEILEMTDEQIVKLVLDK